MGTIRRYMALTVAAVVGALMFASLAVAAGVEVKAKDGIGYYLVDENGMTLYQFKKDSPGKSVCMEANGCLERWPIFYAERVDPSGGVSPAAFDTITRQDGQKQSTFKGLPLYYYAMDKAPGDTNGQGVNNVWYVVRP